MSGLIFIAVFFSSIVGAGFLGVSLNKIALLPLEIYLIVKEGKYIFSVDRVQKLYLIWLFASAFSCITGLLFDGIYYTGVMTGKQLLWIAQAVFIYFPIAVLAWNAKEKELYKKHFIQSLIVTARIHALWGVVQFLLFYTLRFDLNEFVFEELWNGMFGNGHSWTAISNLYNQGNLLRITGLNSDPAFFAMILLVGFILEKKQFWKLLYFGCVVLALSRVGVFSIVCVVIYRSLSKRDKAKIDKSKLLTGVIGTALVIALAVVLYQQVDLVSAQVDRFVARVATMSNGEDGTGRHMGYPFAAVEVLLLDAPFFVKIWGIGLNCAGCLLAKYSTSVPWLDLTGGMLDRSSVWSVECDPANMLLGMGIFGTAVYYYFYYKAFLASKGNVKIRTMIVGLLIFSIMYNMTGTTYMQLILIFLFSQVCSEGDICYADDGDIISKYI